MAKPLKVVLGVVTAILLVGATLGLSFYRNPIWFSDQQIRFRLSRQHVQSHFVEVDGSRIHFLEAAAPAGSPATPLVLIHGLGARGEDWSPLIPTLAAQGFHVYALDLLGYGRSSKPDISYSIEEQEKVVADFMQAEHLGHADIAGWSMGGWIALKLTIDHPALVDRLIVFDSVGLYFPATFNAGLFTPTDTAGLDRLIAMLTPHPRPFPAFVARAAIRKLQNNAWVLNRSLNSMTAGHDLLDFELHHISKPTLIVWGSQDRLVPPSVGETMHRDIPRSSLLLVEGCGHLAPAECSQPILKATVAFLSASPPLDPYRRSVQGTGR